VRGVRAGTLQPGHTACTRAISGVVGALGPELLRSIATRQGGAAIHLTWLCQVRETNSNLWRCVERTPPPFRAVRVDVVVVGGGVAGLAACWSLLRAHPTVTVALLEGRKEVGGRIRTLHLAGAPAVVADAGAAWLHGGAADMAGGGLAHPVARWWVRHADGAGWVVPLLRRDVGRMHNPWVRPDVDVVRWAGGHACAAHASGPQECFASTCDAWWDAVQQVSAASEGTSDVEDADTEKEHERVNEGGWPAAAGKRVIPLACANVAAIVDWLTWQAGCWYGAPPSGVDDEVCCIDGGVGDFRGPHCLVAPGAMRDGRIGCMERLVDALMDAALREGGHGEAARLHVLTSCHVTRVSQDGGSDSVTVTATLEGAPFKIAGSVAICCLPAPVVHSAGLFAPPLPDWKRDALSCVATSQYKKIVLRFAEPPFPHDTPFFVAIPLLHDEDGERGLRVRLLENYAAVKGPDTPVVIGIVYGEDVWAAESTAWNDDECVAAAMAAVARAAGVTSIPTLVSSAVTRWEIDGESPACWSEHTPRGASDFPRSNTDTQQLFTIAPRLRDPLPPAQ